MTHSVLDAGTSAAGYWSTISLNSALPLAMTDTWLVLSCISDVARHGAVWRRRPLLVAPEGRVPPFRPVRNSGSIIAKIEKIVREGLSGCRNRSARSGGMAIHGLSCGSFENCGFTIMAGIDGVDETKGRQTWNLNGASFGQQLTGLLVEGFAQESGA